MYFPSEYARRFRKALPFRVTEATVGDSFPITMHARGITFDVTKEDPYTYVLSFTSGGDFYEVRGVKPGEAADAAVALLDTFLLPATYRSHPLNPRQATRQQQEFKQWRREQARLELRSWLNTEAPVSADGYKERITRSARQEAQSIIEYAYDKMCGGDTGERLKTKEEALREKWRLAGWTEIRPAR